MPDTSKRGMGFNVEKPSSPTKGNNFLLAIGIGKYKFLPNLNNAVKDVQNIVQVLAKKYQFLPDQIQTIFDEEATKDSIVNGLKSLVEKSKNQDNVIIYFVGHGEYDPVFEEGYWMPVDAQKSNEANFIPNSYIKKILGAIKCHHLFVMVDSCFSDTLFNRGIGRVANRLERDPSRWGLTSGKNEVLEGMDENYNSPFAESILYLLETNKKPLGVAELCSKVIEVTATNSKNVPLGEPLNVNGHRGGQFIFHPKITPTSTSNTMSHSGVPETETYIRPAFQEKPPAVKKKKNIRNLLMIGISSLVILLVGGGLVYNKFFRPSELESIRLLKDFSTGSVIVKLEEGKPPYGVTLFRNEILKTEFQHEEQGDLDITEHIDEAGDYELKVEDQDEKQFSEKITIGEDWPGLPENKLVPPTMRTETKENNMIVDIEEGNPPYQLQLRKDDKTVIQMTIEEAGQHIIDISKLSEAAGNYSVVIEDANKQTEKGEITIVKKSTPPTFEFSEKQHDFGNIQDGDKVTHIFEFTNIGFQPLVISKVRPSSRSISTYLSEKTIPSGERGELEITFNSRKRLGRQKKTVKVTANTIPKEIILTIKADVKKAIAEVAPPPKVEEIISTPAFVEPPVVTSKGTYANISFNQNEISFGRVEEGKVVMQAMEFYNLSENELRISDIKTNCSCLKANVSSKTISPRNKGRLDFTFNTKGKTGVQNFAITLYGNTNPIQKVIRLKGEVKKKPTIASAVPPPSYPHFTDSRDKKHYRVMKLKDGKTWMAENLNYEVPGSWCYGNRSSNCEKYGRLYTHSAALKACPQGWHLPSQEEWDNLIKAYGGYPLINQKSDGKDAYQALVRGGKSGFRIDLGGIKGNQANNFSFREDRGFYWSSTIAGGLKYTYSFYNKSIQRHETVSNSAVSCRCVKD